MNDRKLLLVDDDPHIRRLLRIYLRNSPFTLYEAAGGEEALSLAAEHSFEIILLDLVLPHHGGFRLCPRLKQGGYPPPHVIIMTGDDSQETRDSAREAGADDFLAKPFAPEDVVARVNAIAAANRGVSS